MAIVAAADKALSLLAKIKPVQAALAKIAGLSAKLGIDTVSQDRFIARVEQVDNIFDAVNYKGIGDGYSKYKLRKSEVTDKKKEGYQSDYQRLRGYVIERLNVNNPGLGSMYALWVPSFPMAILSDGTRSKGQMATESLTILKEFVQAFPVGTYKVGDIPAPDRTVTPDYSGGVPDLTQSKLAAGDPETVTASFNMPDTKTILIMVGMILVVYLFYKFSKK